MSNWNEPTRVSLWNARKTFKSFLRNTTPSWLRYSEGVSIRNLRDAWPPVAAPSPAPLVYWPSDREVTFFSKVPLFGALPVVLPPVLLHVIRDGFVFSDGTIATADGRLIEESCKDRALAAHTYTHNSFRFRRRRSVGTRLITSIMIGKYQPSYGHTLVDMISRLWPLSFVPERISLLVPSSLSRVSRRLIELAKPDNVEIVPFGNRPIVTSARVLLAPFTTIGGCLLLRPEIVTYLRTKLIGAAEAGVSEGRSWPREIYVSREKTKWSRVSNESALKVALAELGVVPIVVEDYPIEEQVLFFANAELVVGALSSGLVNCVFQSRGALVEIHSGGLRSDASVHSLNNLGIAIAAGIGYWPVYHGHVTSEPSFEVDIPRVCSAVIEARRVYGIGK